MSDYGWTFVNFTETLADNPAEAINSGSGPLSDGMLYYQCRTEHLITNLAVADVSVVLARVFTIEAQRLFHDEMWQSSIWTNIRVNARDVARHLDCLLRHCEGEFDLQEYFQRYRLVNDFLRRFSEGTARNQRRQRDVASFLVAALSTDVCHRMAALLLLPDSEVERIFGIINRRCIAHVEALNPGFELPAFYNNED